MDIRVKIISGILGPKVSEDDYLFQTDLVIVLALGFFSVFLVFLIALNIFYLFLCAKGWTAFGYKEKLKNGSKVTPLDASFESSDKLNSSSDRFRREKIEKILERNGDLTGLHNQSLNSESMIRIIDFKENHLHEKHGTDSEARNRHHTGLKSKKETENLAEISDKSIINQPQNEESDQESQSQKKGELSGDSQIKRLGKLPALN